MTRYGMVIDLDRCVGCLACVSACKEQWDSPLGQGLNLVHCVLSKDPGLKPDFSLPNGGRDWVHCVEGEGDAGRPALSFYPGLCNHCDRNPCIDACPTGATFKDADGVVLIDPDVCIGCGYCIPACPYGARYRDERRGVADKCTFCRPLTDRGLEPACVSTCLAACRTFGDLSNAGDPAARLARERGAAGLETATAALGPNVLYVGQVHRERIKAAGVPGRYTLPRAGRAWAGILNPVAKLAVAGGVLGVAGAAALNRWAERRRRVKAEDQAPKERS